MSKVKVYTYEFDHDIGNVLYGADTGQQFVDLNDYESQQKKIVELKKSCEIRLGLTKIANDQLKESIARTDEAMDLSTKAVDQLREVKAMVDEARKQRENQ